MGFSKGDELNFMAFPILAAIARKPMTSRELQHTLLISKAQMNKRLRQLRDQNLITRRDDRKWIPLVVLRMEAPPTPVAYPEEKVPAGEPVGPRIIAPERDETSDAFHSVPRLDGPEVTHKRLGPPPKPKGSPQAQMVAKRLNVPSVRREGEASMGGVGQCACGRTTPMRYGTTSVCPICARK